MSDSSPDESTTDGPDYRQLSLVALAAIALVLAAFLAPAGGGISAPSIDPDAPDTRPMETGPELPDERQPAPPEQPAEGDGPPAGDFDALPDVDIDWPALLEWFEFGWFGGEGEGDGDVEEVREPGQPERLPESPCTVWLHSDPVPGSELTATIRDGVEPVTGVPVWYNDRYVGETDADGEVVGEVPYVEELVVRIDTEAHPACAAVEDPSSSVAGPAPVAVTGSGVGSGAGSPTLAAVPSDAGAFASARQETPENGTVTYEVGGEVEIAVHAPADPGATVPVEATVENVPMANATVTVDGEGVAETAADGTATVEIPDDGSDSFELGVSRGDFEGTTTVDVRLLEVSLSPEGLAPIPGSPGVVEATIADEPVADAEVRIDGELVGTTDDEGELGIALPVDPTATITVTTGDRTETVSLAGAYGDVALAAAIAVVALTGLAYRSHGRRGAAAALGASGAVLLVLVVEAFYGPVAGGAVLLAAVALLAAGALRSDGSVSAERPDAAGAVRRFVDWFVARTLALVAVLERALEWLRARLAAVRAWASTLPRSGTELGRRLAAWLGALPGRTIERSRRALGRLRGLPLGTVAAGAVAVAAVAGGYVVDGRRGAAVVAALAIAVALYRLRPDETEPEPTGDDAGDDGEPTGVPEPTATDADSDDRLSFRELWRAFARRVAPRRWRRNTPGEIRRTALEQGYPDRPVDELTTLFREVEYGGRSLSSRRRDRADEAYAELVAARDEESEGDGTDETTAGAADGNRDDATGGDRVAETTDTDSMTDTNRTTATGTDGTESDGAGGEPR